MLPNLAPISNVPTGNLLIIDDDDINRMLLRDTLEVQGHTIIEASNGSDALRLIEQKVPDVVLSDVMMPQMDGCDVCRRIKENPATAHVPVLLITTLSDRDERLAGLQAGANDFISKPIDVAEVTLRVRNAVQSKKLFDSLQAARNPLAQTLKLLRPLRKRAAKAASTQKALAQACQILQDLSRRFDQLTSRPDQIRTAKAA